MAGILAATAPSAPSDSARFAPRRRKSPARGGATVKLGHNAAKRELVVQARRAGWKGKSYKSAKKFEQKLQRQARTSATSHIGEVRDA